MITTPFHDRYSTAEQLKAMQATIPMNRLGSADECAGTFLYLASDAMSGYVTGQIIEVNGGQLHALSGQCPSRSAGSSARRLPATCRGGGPWRSTGAPARLIQNAVKPNACAPMASQPFADTNAIAARRAARACSAASA